MSFFTPTDFEIFSEAHASDPGCDVPRVQLRGRLASLHGEIYPEIRARKWDLHPHWVAQYLISTARIQPAMPRIDFLLLRYSKAETIVRMMKKEFGEDFTHPYRTALLGVRIDALGLAVEMLVSDRAWVDAQNFKNKLVHGAPEKRHLRQLLAELGGDYTLTYETSEPRQEILRTRCSRLVNLGTLDTTIAKFSPGEHQIKVAIHYPPGHPCLEDEALPTEILLRLGQLYLLYQFVNWSPRNDYVSHSNLRDQKSELNP